MFEKSRTRLVNVHHCHYVEQCLFCYYSGGGINNAPLVLEMQCARMANNAVFLIVSDEKSHFFLYIWMNSASLTMFF